MGIFKASKFELGFVFMLFELSLCELDAKDELEVVLGKKGCGGVLHWPNCALLLLLPSSLEFEFMIAQHCQFFQLQTYCTIKSPDLFGDKGVVGKQE